MAQQDADSRSMRSMESSVPDPEQRAATITSHLLSGSKVFQSASILSRFETPSRPAVSNNRSSIFAEESRHDTDLERRDIGNEYVPGPLPTSSTSRVLSRHPRSASHSTMRSGMSPCCSAVYVSAKMFQNRTFSWAGTSSPSRGCRAAISSLRACPRCPLLLSGTC